MSYLQSCALRRELLDLALEPYAESASASLPGEAKISQFSVPDSE